MISRPSSPGYMDVDDLDLYFRNRVIRGQGSFMMPVRG
jgi:hypothetical protein